MPPVGEGEAREPDAKDAGAPYSYYDPSLPDRRQEASNRHELLRSKAVVVNVMVKRRGSDHVRYG